VHVTTERCGAAALEVREHGVLLGREGVLVPQRRTVGARNVADLHAAGLARRAVHATGRVAHARLAEHPSLLPAEYFERVVQLVPTRFAELRVARRAFHGAMPK